jgi:hypothetical protein
MRAFYVLVGIGAVFSMTVIAGTASADPVVMPGLLATVPPERGPSPSWCGFNTDDNVELQSGGAGILVEFVWKYVMTEDDKQALGAYVRNAVVNGYHRAVRFFHGNDAPQSGRWAFVAFDVEGIDPDDDGDPDYYLESDSVDYDYDGQIDSRSAQRRAGTIQQVEGFAGNQLSAVDAWLRQRRL